MDFLLGFEAELIAMRFLFTGNLIGFNNVLLSMLPPHWSTTLSAGLIAVALDWFVGNFTEISRPTLRGYGCIASALLIGALSFNIYQYKLWRKKICEHAEQAVQNVRICENAARSARHELEYNEEWVRHFYDNPTCDYCCGGPTRELIDQQINRAHDVYTKRVLQLQFHQRCAARWASDLDAAGVSAFFRDLRYFRMRMVDRKRHQEQALESM